MCRENPARFASAAFVMPAISAAGFYLIGVRRPQIFAPKGNIDIAGPGVVFATLGTWLTTRCSQA